MSAIGSKCRSGCKEKSHGSYGECLRAARSGLNLTATPGNAWDKELALYRSAREQGIQPASTRTPDIVAAVEMSDRTGTAFDAGVGA